MLFTVLPLSFIIAVNNCGRVAPIKFHLTVTMINIIFKLATKHVALPSLVPTFSMAASVEPRTFVHPTMLVDLFPLANNNSFLHFALVDVQVWQCELSKTIWSVLCPVALVRRVFVDKDVIVLVLCKWFRPFNCFCISRNLTVNPKSANDAIWLHFDTPAKESSFLVLTLTIASIIVYDHTLAVWLSLL